MKPEYIDSIIECVRQSSECIDVVTDVTFYAGDYDPDLHKTSLEYVNPSKLIELLHLMKEGL